MQKFKFTLTRWHKIVERLNASVSEHSAEALRRCNTTFNLQAKSSYTEASVENLATHAETSALAASTLLNDVAVIRAALGEANHKTGISKLMAEMDVAQRQSNLYKSFRATEDRIDFKAFSNMESKDIYRNDVSIKVLSDKQAAHFNDEANRFKRITVQISDQIAGLNATQIEIEISDEAVKAASL